MRHFIFFESVAAKLHLWPCFWRLDITVEVLPHFAEVSFSFKDNILLTTCLERYDVPFLSSKFGIGVIQCAQIFGVLSQVSECLQAC